MMDKDATQCAEAYVGAGYPLDAEGLLIVELDGPPVEVDYLVERVAEIARGARRHDDPRQPRRAGAGAVLGRPQGGVPRRRPDLARLHVPRRLGAARQAGRGAGRDARSVEAVWPARRERLPCRRRQPPSADPVRRQRSRRAAALRGTGRRHPAALRAGRRRADRRARRRHREARPDGRAVHRDRPRPADAREMRLRSRPSAQPRQGLPPSCAAAPNSAAWS